MRQHPPVTESPHRRTPPAAVPLPVLSLRPARRVPGVAAIRRLRGVARSNAPRRRIGGVREEQRVLLWPAAQSARRGMELVHRRQDLFASRSDARRDSSRVRGGQRARARGRPVARAFADGINVG